MSLADKLIGDGVKEGYEDHAGDVYLYRGIAKFNFEIFDDAIVDFKHAITFNRNLTQSYLYIAEIYYDLNQFLNLYQIVFFWFLKFYFLFGIYSQKFIEKHYLI